MNVLWITNILFPDIAESLGVNSPLSGGWMYAMAEYVKNCTKLSVATVWNNDEFIHEYINDIDYYVLPLKKRASLYQKHLEGYWRCIYDKLQPDVVHIHGTEYPHGLAFVKACPEAKIVCSIQGLTSEVYKYYYTGLTRREIILNLTIKSFLRRNESIFRKQKELKERSKYEKEIISKVRHIIGRTEWDKAHILSINPNAKYHICNRVLRKEFYQHRWDYNRCKHHSIFISQASFPYKGLHQVIKAMPYVLQRYPDASVYVAGPNPIAGRVLFKRMPLRSNYGKIIYRMMKNNQLVDKIYYMGLLGEKEMCEWYLKCNVFVCSSSIENESNSLYEAQLLGMPCISSYVGGLAETMRGGEEWLYRFEDVKMLAHLICKVFESSKDCYVNELWKIRNDQNDNVRRLIDIYTKI